MYDSKDFQIAVMEQLESLELWEKFEDYGLVIENFIDGEMYVGDVVDSIVNYIEDLERTRIEDLEIDRARNK